MHSSVHASGFWVTFPTPFLRHALECPADVRIGPMPVLANGYIMKHVYICALLTNPGVSHDAPYGARRGLEDASDMFRTCVGSSGPRPPHAPIWVGCPEPRPPSVGDKRRTTGDGGPKPPYENPLYKTTGKSLLNTAAHPRQHSFPDCDHAVRFDLSRRLRSCGVAISPPPSFGAEDPSRFH